MTDVNYGQWADHIITIFRRCGLKPELIADLGCGTGSFCLEMAHRGYDMIGIDLSAEMLSCARQKALQAGADILFLNQDMTSFELYGTVDAITCLMDSVNYVTYKNDLKQLFKLVANYLNPNGLFVFDINSPYKFENIFSANAFCETNPEASYIWQNCYDKSKKLCRFDLTFFVREGDLFRRFDEVHYERSYTREELEEMLAVAGLRLCSVYGGFSFRKPSEKCQRIFFICKKEG
ncbi:MAG: class I SAM-dependent methyltransferase [Clostridiaceae bacterium]